MGMDGNTNKRRKALTSTSSKQQAASSKQQAASNKRQAASGKQ
jgi:hypothetical protein